MWSTYFREIPFTTSKYKSKTLLIPSLTIQIMNLIMIKYIINFILTISLPVQLKPSPSYPWLQEQLCDPSVFVQFAFSSHLLMFIAHWLNLASDKHKIIDYSQVSNRYGNQNILSLTYHHSGYHFPDILCYKYTYGCHGDSHMLRCHGNHAILPRIRWYLCER